MLANSYAGMKHFGATLLFVAATMIFGTFARADESAWPGPFST